MKKLIKINLLLSAIAGLVLFCSATIMPHPTDCKKNIITVGIGENGSGGSMNTVITCFPPLCFIPDLLVCDFPEKCKKCNQ